MGSPPLGPSSTGSPAGAHCADSLGIADDGGIPNVDGDLDALKWVQRVQVGIPCRPCRCGKRPLGVLHSAHDRPLSVRCADRAARLHRRHADVRRPQRCAPSALPALSAARPQRCALSVPSSNVPQRILGLSATGNPCVPRAPRPAQSWRGVWPHERRRAAGRVSERSSAREHAWGRARDGTT